MMWFISRSLGFLLESGEHCDEHYFTYGGTDGEFDGTYYRTGRADCGRDTDRRKRVLPRRWKNPSARSMRYPGICFESVKKRAKANSFDGR